MSDALTPTPTARAVIDPLRRCSVNCSFCYYRHKGQEWVNPIDVVERQIDQAAARGNTAIDITGGEPLVHPDIVRMVRYAQGRHGMDVRVITSCIGNGRAVDELLDCVPPDWLISVHGPEPRHDSLVGFAGARKRQLAMLDKIQASSCPTFCTNTVIVRDNQEELVELAKWLAEIRPRVVNLINFNPHHEWRSSPQTAAMVANWQITERQLAEAIPILEAAGCGVNVRYYPMCRLPAEYRRCVCNDLHVAFDSGEWDYDITPKTFQAFRAWSLDLSERTEEQGEPCNRCPMHAVCGGANRYGHAVSQQLYGELLTPIDDPDADPGDFYAYRKHNARGMA